MKTDQANRLDPLSLPEQLGNIIYDITEVTVSLWKSCTEILKTKIKWKISKKPELFKNCIRRKGNQICLVINKGIKSLRTLLQMQALSMNLIKYFSF